MNIHLYKTKTPTKENINKKLTNEKIIENVVFKQHGSLDVLNPTVILNGFNDISEDVEISYIGKSSIIVYNVSISLNN